MTSLLEIENVRQAHEIRRLRTRLKAAEEALIEIVKDDANAGRIANETLKLIRE